MKLQNLTVIFIIIIIPVILLVSLYISTGLKTLKYQSLYDSGLLTSTHSAISAFELNTTNDAYSDNAETKRNILKSSVKMFEKSLANTCNISAYNTDEIEEYIPAIVFGMYDGFYMYAPSYNSKTGKYEHDLKNYVYYSETLDDSTVITYSLDNYITVSGKFNDNYIVKEGYLVDYNDSTADGTQYKGIAIDTNDTKAINYYKDAYKFTKWFKDNVEDKADYLKIGKMINGQKNDPENEKSAFVQHKREIMKKKIESVLNSSITAYSERTWNRTYKMPKLSEEDWQKIYSNISMITFFQGKNIGLTKYNGYCVLNSTDSNEYVNPNLMYFIDNTGTYHDIRCGKCKDATKLIGYKIGDFQKIKLSKALDENGNPIKDENGNQLYDNDGTKTTDPYKYKHMELACYDCINGSLSINKSVYSYVNLDNGTASPVIKTSYWTSLARERYKASYSQSDETTSTKFEKTTFVKDEKGKVFAVPAGYTIVKDDTTANTVEVDKGVVITDELDAEGKSIGNEFVWVPVNNINSMAKVTSGTDANGRTNYQGVLYNFNSTGAPEYTNYGQGTTSCREPDVVLKEFDSSWTLIDGGDNNSDNLKIINDVLGTRYANSNDFLKGMQEDFNRMVESVAKYGGFYVGRYEMSYSGTAKSVSGVESAMNTTSDYDWYGLYAKAKTYTNSENSVESSMIYGSQYDAMMRWMQSNGIDVTRSNPKDTTGITASKNTTRVTGAEGSTDKLNNVYDLLGNSYEWTQEANNTFIRVSRGGNCNYSRSPSDRDYAGSPTITHSNGYVGSRLSLYIK